MRFSLRAWRDRSLPTCIGALQYVRASYAQFGEDTVLDKLLGAKRIPGHFVDVGCFHPIKWSNTYKFYLRGWRGICVDPNPELGAAWRKYRPEDRYVNCAVARTAGESEYASHHDKPQENHLGAVSADSDFSVQRVVTKPLSEILAEHLPTNARIDFMSIDCEGHDLEVLQSNDFVRHRPQFLIVEHHYNRETDELPRYCESLRYRMVGLCGWSKIYKSEIGW